MKIDVLTNDGSPIGVTSKTIWGSEFRVGVGGAELALLTMCEQFAKRGHDIVLYNNPVERGVSPFEQRFISEFQPMDDRDILIIFRSPNIRSVPAKGLKVWWSCDQYTIGSFANFAKTVQKIVTISPFHQKYFKEVYGIHNTMVTDLPVRDDPVDETIERIPNRFLWSTVPDRGLDVLWRMWPAILRDVPDATVAITSDYRLWGAYGSLNERYKARWVAHKNVEFLGAVPRQKLLEEQRKASVMLYHSLYDELFCIAVAEAQCAGIYPITNNRAALATTNMGTVVGWENANDPHGDKFFVDEAVSFLFDLKAEERRKELMEKARRRFSPDRIAEYWEKEIFNENTGTN